ncbi:hypothetical protein TWF694_004114 [Orbilia ellipsospora]|uniref:Serine-threonine protein kinase 19 n=1 Tax=Orbilia ellipsospora TaxID=2528407 RepID=A0AAV9WZ87_9PEZI
MLNLTAGYRIKKRVPGAAAQRKNPLNQLHRKTSSSPRKPASSIAATPSLSSSSSSFSLCSLGWPTDDSAATLPTTVPEAIAYILAHQFTPLPETLTGLGLSRDTIADILNFRRSLPPVVPIPHLHSLLPSPTETERAIASLIADGTLRKVQIRTGNASYLEGVIQTDDFLKSVAQSSGIDSDTKDALLSLLAADPTLATITSDMTAKNSLSKDTIMSLLSAGFLVINQSPSPSSDSTSGGAGGVVDITTLTPTTAMKTIAPLPEKDHSHISTLASLASVSSSSRNGNIGSYNSSRASVNLMRKGDAIEYTITPPHLGLLTHSYTSSKSHMLDMLRHVPHREATMGYLREKWDGGVSKNKNKTRKRGAEVKFEGRTRKWKEFRGLTVDWVIGGLMGSGVVEGFDTAVGKGVRLVKGN